MVLLLRWTGWACTLIGLMHLLGGIATVPGEGGTGATVDSRERFYGAVFGAYGLAWVWAAEQRPVPTGLARGLAGMMAVGGAGRILSRVLRGRPHWFQDVLTVVEFGLPAAALVLAAREDRQRAALSTTRVDA